MPIAVYPGDRVAGSIIAVPDGNQVAVIATPACSTNRMRLRLRDAGNGGRRGRVRIGAIDGLATTVRRPTARLQASA
ncbi:MAG TPA: hypothetical protein VNG51_21915 [Ktedonobacteraceae bacterium]|nr:hypothetical protein [Ktedonobacteraceae bacterium]